MGVFIFCEVIQSRENPSQSLCVFEVIETWGHVIPMWVTQKLRLLELHDASLHYLYFE